jgi:hypothetical protein
MLVHLKNAWILASESPSMYTNEQRLGCKGLSPGLVEPGMAEQSLQG